MSSSMDVPEARLALRSGAESLKANKGGEMGDTGICLSGGGLRAASFSLGALQALHHRYGLLRGSNSARWLSAVSGGSYIAGTLTLLNAGSRASYTPSGSREFPSLDAQDLGPSEAPLAPGSPEVDHIIRNCRYLVDQGGLRTSLLLASLMAAGLGTILLIIAWIGTMLLADLGFIGVLIWPQVLMLDAGAQWALSVLGIALLVVAFQVVRIKKKIVKALAFLPQLALLFLSGVGIAALNERMSRIPILASPAWTIRNLLLVVGSLIVVPLVAWLLAAVGRRFKSASLQLIGNSLWVMYSWLFPWLLALLITCWVGLYLYGRLLEVLSETASDADGMVTLGLFFLVLIMAVLIIPLPGLFNPHKPYRTMISRCFMVRRTREGASAVEFPDKIAMSSLVPPSCDGIKYPELVICAAANINERGATAAGSNVLPLIITGDQVTVPNRPNASLLTADLEAMERPKWVNPRPIVSLASAIAVTGAALSPAMGKSTQPRLRPLFAALNIRLGVWLPNPLSTKARAAGSERKAAKFAVTIDQLLWEFVGRHSEKSPLLYASDGGHYENLGLVHLIREECSNIWCVDASGDKPGRASALTESIMLAEAETGCHIDIDIDRFATSSMKNELNFSHAIGSVKYANGKTASLNVVKLGLTSETSAILREYARIDQGFPFHSTVRQVYRGSRFEAYVRLGREATIQLCNEVDGLPLVESVQARPRDGRSMDGDSTPERRVTESGLSGGCAVKFEDGDQANLPSQNHSLSKSTFDDSKER
jgi:hypothetical protein